VATIKMWSNLPAGLNYILNSDGSSDLMASGLKNSTLL